MTKSPFKPRRDFITHLLFEIEIHGRMLLVSPERRAEMQRLLRMLRSNRKADSWALKRYQDGAAFQAILKQRPLSPFPRVNNAIWSHYRLLAPELKHDPCPSSDKRRALKAYDLARRAKPTAALDEIDALIAHLKGQPENVSGRQLLVDMYLVAGAVGYMICEETAAAYYVEASALAVYKTPALLVLGAILLRLHRVDQAKAAWSHAFRIERASYERMALGPHTLGQYESLQDAKVELDKLEAMIASLDKLPKPATASSCAN